MLKDPQGSWPGGNPYEALASAGITPGSSQKEVLEASFRLMAKRRLTAEVRAAWDRLRDPASRLEVDFLFYAVDLEGELERAAGRLAVELEAWAEVAVPASLLAIEETDLAGLEADFGPLALAPVEVAIPADLPAYSPFATAAAGRPEKENER